MAQKSFYRSDRVSAQLRRELGKIVHETVRNHGLPSLSVSDVEITRDLAHATVFVTALMQESSAEAVKALKALTPEMRYQLGRAMKLRHVPELHFHYDDSVDRGERINNLLRDNPATSADADGDDADGGDVEGEDVAGGEGVADVDGDSDTAAQDRAGGDRD